MDPTANMSVATDFFSRFNADDIAGALGSLTDDGTWWVAGRPGTPPFVGTLSKERVAALFYRMTNQTTDGLCMTIKSVVAQGNKVALEIESYAQLKNGRIYNQQYHTLMEFCGGKICAVREYLDTQHVLAVWFAPGAEVG
jgi:ketosteroid isomerase-like protein